MQKIEVALRAVTQQLQNAVSRGDIRGGYNAAARGAADAASAALAEYEKAQLEGKDLNSTAQRALEFLVTLRNSRPDEVVDLLTNNAAEDMERDLARALDSPVAESDSAVHLRRRATFKATTPLGDIEYYLDANKKELGHVVFPGSVHETVFVQERQWDEDILRHYDLTDLRRTSSAVEFLWQLLQCAELNQDSLEPDTVALLAKIKEAFA